MCFGAKPVKVLRPDVKAQTRSGYFAVPLADGKPVMAYEMPMLAAVNGARPPHDFPHRAAALRFGADAIGARSERRRRPVFAISSWPMLHAAAADERDLRRSTSTAHPRVG